MNLQILNAAYGWLKKQSPEVVRLVCIALLLWIFGNYTATGVKRVLNNSKNTERQDKDNREQYTVDITLEVNKYIQNVLNFDANASNVILLNYHNTLLSSNGLSYKYLTAVCEKFQGEESRPCMKEWKELDYLNYGEEIQKINASKYIMLEDSDKDMRSFPKFVWVMHNSGIKTACFYPIIGVHEPVGMLIIGYRDKVTPVDLEYIRRLIYPTIQPLASLLDYNAHVNKTCKNEES